MEESVSRERSEPSRGGISEIWGGEGRGLGCFRICYGFLMIGSEIKGREGIFLW